jgi:uncharacterized protein DUF4160
VPTVLRAGPYRFFFYSNEGSEPPHIHVEAGGKSAKFWLQPVALGTNHGFAGPAIREIERIVVAHRDELERAWHAYFQP